MNEVIECKVIELYDVLGFDNAHIVSCAVITLLSTGCKKAQFTEELVNAAGETKVRVYFTEKGRVIEIVEEE